MTTATARPQTEQFAGEAEIMEGVENIVAQVWRLPNSTAQELAFRRFQSRIEQELMFLGRLGPAVSGNGGPARFADGGTTLNQEISKVLKSDGGKARRPKEIAELILEATGKTFEVEAVKDALLAGPYEHEGRGYWLNKGQ